MNDHINSRSTSRKSAWAVGPAVATAVLAAAVSLPVAAQPTGGGTNSTVGGTSSTTADAGGTTTRSGDRDWGWLGLLGLAGLLGLRRKSDVSVDRTRTSTTSASR